MSKATANKPQTTLISARWIVPIEPENTVLEQHSIAITNGKIIGLLPTNKAITKYPDAIRIDKPNHLLTAGFVNAHTHAAMNLYRGIADDLPLMEWLNEHIWPAEAKWVSPDFIRDGVELAIAEMLSSGTTCFNDMYFFPDIVAKTAQEIGIRATVGLIVIDFPTVWAKDADEYLDKGLAVHDETRSLSLINTAFAPHAPYTVSNAPLEKIRTYADELDIPIHMHVHETAHEVQESVAQFSVRPLERLENLGLLSQRLLAVHMTQLLPAEIEAVAKYGVHVLHCPESNLKLNSGYCQVRDLNTANANVALGTDSAASNNDLDMLGEMRTAALIAKTVANDATALPAWKALRMATINGAKALGLNNEIGSLEIGKSADIIAIDMNDISTQPVYDPVAQLVYSASRKQISDVWVHGKQLLKQHKLTTVDANSIIEKAKHWGEKIQTTA